MADKIIRDRAKDASIKTDDLDLGSIDDISLDFPGSGDEGVDFGKGRKASSPKKEFAIEFAKGIGGGVRAAAASELRKALPDAAAIVDEGAAALADFQAMKDDLSKQLAPITTTLENAGRKVLPRVERYLPKKFYDKIHKKLEDRAAARQGYPSKSKEQTESELIAADLAQLFGQQVETSYTEMKERKKELVIDRALGAARHKQNFGQLTHVYSAVRATELFHKTQHMAYMKKSLELKYKHLFIARDTFNLLQQSMKTFEGYYKGILANTALPDMAKVMARDYVKKSRTDMYGTMMANAMSNIRQKIFGRIKDSIGNVVSQAGFMSDMLGMGAEMSDMGMGPKKDVVPGLLGNLVGFIGGSSKLNSLFNPYTGKYRAITGTLNNSFAGIRANAASRLSELQEKMTMSTNPILSALADFIPNAMSQTNTASNDILNKGKDAAVFDVMTRQSITEIIPGYLGKIWHEIEMMRTGDETVEEKTYNAYERKFTTVSTLKQDVFDVSFGTEEQRRAALTKTLATMQAGVARNKPTADAAHYFDAYEKDINRIMINHAQFGKTFKPKMLHEFAMTGHCDDMGYIQSVTKGLRHDPAEVLGVICDSMFDADGNPNTNVINDLQLAITENFRKMDAWRAKMPDVMETFGLRQYFAGDLAGAEEERLRKAARLGDAKAAARLREHGGLISSTAGINLFDMEKMAGIRADGVDYSNINVDRDADWYRRSAYTKYRTADEVYGKIRRKMDSKTLGKIAQGAAGGKGLLSKFGHFLMGSEMDVFTDPKMVAFLDKMVQDGTLTPQQRLEIEMDPKAVSKVIDMMAEQDKAKFTDGLFKGLGIATRRPGAQYDDVFHVAAANKNSGKAKEKTSIFNKAAWKNLSRDTGALFGGATASAAATETPEPPKTPDTETTSRFQKAKNELKKRKAEFAKSPTGKKVFKQLSRLEKIYDEAEKRGSQAIEELQQAGAFDNPTEFLKDQLGKASKRMSEFTETLPSMVDTASWGTFISEKTSQAADFGKGVFGTVKDKTLGALRSGKEFLSGKLREGLSEAGIKIPENESLHAQVGSGAGGAVPPPETPSVPSDFGDRMDKMYSLLEDWKKTSTDNQGTISDAIAQVDATLRKVGGPGGGGSPINEKELSKQLQHDLWENSYFVRGGRLAKRAIGAGIKGVGKLYAKTYSAALKGAGTALKGIGFAAGTAIDRGYKMVSGAAKWLTAKPDFVDVYLKGKEGGIPLVTARKQKDEGIFRKSNGKRIEASNEINEPCVDKDGNLVITEEDIKTGLVINNGSPIGKIGTGLLSLGKSYLGLYGKALGAIGGVAKTVAQGLFGKAAEQWQDVYRKDEIGKGPLITARKQKEEGVYFFESGKKVERSSDIHEPVCDRDRKILVSKEDIEHGLVDVDNKPLGSGATGGAIRALLRGVGGAMPGIGKFIGKVGGGLAEIYTKGYKGLMDVGFGALKGAGKFLGRALGLNLTGEGLGDGKQTLSILQKMQMDLALIADQYRTKTNPNDKDGDGDIDGSYADQMEKKKLENKRVDARDVHKDVNWKKDAKEDGRSGGDDDEGGGIFDFVKNLIPDKFARKFKIGKYLLKKRSLATLGKAGRFLLGKGAALRAAAMPALSTAGHWLAGTAMPTVTGALGSAGSAIGGMLGGAGSAIGSALGGLGGLGGIGSGLAAAGSAALPFLGPAALAALAGYGIYRGVKGFSKKNTLENVGEGEGISKENQLTGEDRMYSALGMNSKWGAKTAKFISQGLGIHGLIKGIRGNDNPLTDKEIEAGRNKLQRKADKKLPGYDRILQEYEKAVQAGNWSRARQLSGKEADGLIKSMWKNSYLGMAVSGIGNLIFGNKDKEMTQEEIQKARDKFQSKIKKGGREGKNAEKLLDKFDDAVAEQNWKKAREIAGAEERGLFGKLFQDSRGNIKWGSVIGTAIGGVPGYLLGSIFNKTDVNKPMTEEEVKKERDRLQQLINKGNKAAEKVLQQFDEAVTEQNWKKARQLTGQQVKSGLANLDSGLKSTMKWTTRIGTLGLSMLFESDQEKPMTDEEIKKFTDKMNYLINSKHDKVAERKLERFEKAIAANDWEKARQIAKMPHKSVAAKAFKSYVSFWWGDDDKEMTEAEINKFRESMGRKIKLGGATAKAAQKKLDSFEDAIQTQNWRKARKLAESPNDGLYQKAGKAYGKFVANNFRFIFGGDGKPMTETEIAQARKEMGWAISEGKKGAQKRLDRFEDLVADEKWEKARQLAKMPYDNIASRTLKSVGGWLFGNDKNAMSPEEIDKFRSELEQKIADNPGSSAKLTKALEQFNAAVDAENWAKARKISGIKDWGTLGAVAKGISKLNPFNWFTDTYEDCQELKTKIEEKIDEDGDDSGMITKGLQHFETLVRRKQYDEAVKFGKDILKLDANELQKKHGEKVATDEFKRAQKNANDLRAKIDKAYNESGFFSFIRKTRLKLLQMKLKNNPDRWADIDFLDEIKQDLSDITGEKEESENKPDDAVIKKGEQLVKDIKDTSNKFSWFGSPLVKTKLASLRREVESDTDDWDDGMFQSWRERLREIAGDETVDSDKASTSAAEEEKKDVETGNTEHVDKVNIDGHPVVEGAKTVGRSVGKAITAQGRAFQNGTAVSTYGAIGGPVASTIKKVGNPPISVASAQKKKSQDGLIEDVVKLFMGAVEASTKVEKKTYTDEERDAAWEKAEMGIVDEDISNYQSDAMDDWHRQASKQVDKICKDNGLPVRKLKGGLMQIGDSSRKLKTNLSLDHDTDIIWQEDGDYSGTLKHSDFVFIDEWKEANNRYSKQRYNDLFKEPLPKLEIPTSNVSKNTVSTVSSPFLSKLDPNQFKEFENKFARGGFARGNRGGLLNNIAGATNQILGGSRRGRQYRNTMQTVSDVAGSVVNVANAIGGLFATQPTAAVDANGNPIVYGEAGTEAIMPLDNRPGNLTSQVGVKLGELQAGQDIGESATTPAGGEASVHAEDAASEPMVNHLARSLYDAMGGSRGRGGHLKATTSQIMNLTRANRRDATGATELAESIGRLMSQFGFANGGFFKDLSLVKLANNLGAGAADMVDKAASSVKDVVKENPLDKLSGMFDSLTKSIASAVQPKTSGTPQKDGVEAKLAEMVDLNKTLVTILQSALSKDGLRMAGLEQLAAVLAANQGGNGGNAQVIHIAPPEQSGLDLRKISA